ncbi:MAG: hypothetical protein HC767_05775, partial [Akkermansiaceae bacterium]|nr:hypothetical protein [Akkermansiaceae bacterium]
PPLLLSPQKLALVYTRSSQDIIAQRNGSPLFAQAALLALQEAREAYCPYSKSPAGAAIVTDNGKVYGGGYMESCAYNPSMQVCCCLRTNRVPLLQCSEGLLCIYCLQARASGLPAACDSI